MPILSQLFGVKKGSNSSSSRQGLFPFSRKSSASSRSRQHLRTKSDNTAVYRSSFSDGVRYSDFSRRTVTPSYTQGDYREPYESRYERYRQNYLVTSPERELSTLNAAIVNVRKWLRKKHDCLRTFQTSSGDNRLWVNEEQEKEQKALLEKLVREAGHQQEAVDVLLDRGRRYLDLRACITLEVDLDNLAFLWNSYARQLFLLQERACIGLPDPPLIPEPPLSPGEGKENIILTTSTPLKWRKGAKASSDKPAFSPESERQSLSITPERRNLFVETPEKQIAHVTTEKQDLSPTPSFSSNGYTKCDSVPQNKSPGLPYTELNQLEQGSAPDQTSFTAAWKEGLLETSFPVAQSVEEKAEESEKKIRKEALEKDLFVNSRDTNCPHSATGQGLSPTEPGTTTPIPNQSVQRKRSSDAESGTEVKATAAALENNKGRACSEEKNSSEESTGGLKQAKEAKLPGRARKPSSPRSERARVLSASLWSADNSSGNKLLKVAGEGIFSSSIRQQHSSRSLSDLSRCQESLANSSSIEVKNRRSWSQFSTSERSPTTTTNSSIVAEEEEEGVFFNQPEATDTHCAEGLIEKRDKEIHNEQQQQKNPGGRQLDNQTEQESPGHSDVNPQQAGLQFTSGLTASEENLKMEIEEALKEINGSLTDVSGNGESLMDLSSCLLDTSAASVTKDTKMADESLLTDDPDLALEPNAKRRRMDAGGSGLSSCSGSPLVSGDSSLTGTPTDSPAGTLTRDFRQRYKKDELWRAIESNYKYLMDKEIIETCQSTESDLTVEDEEVVPNVSFAEFLKQYQELIDWLNQAQHSTQRTINSLSEKYLNQTYQEEMLEKSPRREFLHKYAQQLLLRYPSLKDQVNLRMQRLNAQWQAVEAAISPLTGDANTHSMLQDLECDLAALRRWLNATESRLLPLTIRADWSDAELEERLRQHQVLQQDIESHSRIVSAVLKLSERLEQVRVPGTCGADGGSVQLVALGLERRWHGIWLQSLEWQCRLEEAINRRKGLYGSGFNFSGFNLPTVDESYLGSGSDLDLKEGHNVTTSSNGSLFELSDDSLLFIGARTEHRVDTPSPPGPTSSSPSPLTLTLGQRSLNPPTLPLASPKLTNFLDRSSGDSANISESESNRMADSPREAPTSDLSPGVGGDNEGRSSGVGLMSKTSMEPKDIGYSSESQSNDETESMQQQIALECRYAGIIEVASDSPLGEKMAIPPAGAVRQDYYCMTHVELDSTTDKTTTDDGNTTDDRENHVKEAAGKSLGGGVSGGSFGKLNIESVLGPKGSREDIAVKSWLESSDEPEEGDERGQVCEAGEEVMSMSPGKQGGSSLYESDSSTESKEKIRYLIDHAEDLVKTSPRSPVPGSPKRRVSPCKQTQTVIPETSNVESSCDASSENSDESGGEEFSTATDDADGTLFDSVINLDSTNDSLVSREDVSAAAFGSSVALDNTRLRKQTGPRGGKRDRPWSVVGYQDLKKIDFQPLSTSESAIDRIHPATDTDSSSSHFVSSSTFPRRSRNRGYQRAVSLCETTSVTTAPPVSRAVKRKLKYSSSSSATESQASRSSGTQLAASTEEEDERTLLYDSADQQLAESETTDEYVTASMDEMVTSADEDPHNSTGSFSENAWDSYQMIYPTASEDATEEVLHWEPVDDMEFDDDFAFSFPKGPSLLNDAISRRNNKLKLKAKASGGDCEDSDSDMEDFRSVLEDSETCLKVVDHSLKKKRSNPMGTGLARHGKYAEILATCETNISCVENVCQHLTQEDIGLNDLQRVQDLLCQWEKLHGLAADRHQQSQQLSGVSEAVAATKKALGSAQQCLNFELFTSKEELEATITTLRVKVDELLKQRQVLCELGQVIADFEQHHPVIDVSRYREELTVLDTTTADMHNKVAKHAADLETNWAVWCEYLDGQRELDMLMAADRERLYALLCQREAGHRITRTDVLRELETLQDNLRMYESKLEVLQALRQRLTCVSNDDTQRSFLASLADLRNQLQVVSDRCRGMYRDVEEEEKEERAFAVGQLAISPAAVRESQAVSRDTARVHAYDAEAALSTGDAPYRMVRGGRAWSWLRSVPVQIVALMMVAGLVYVLDPDILSDLAAFSLTFTPELRHVNGPPPL